MTYERPTVYAQHEAAFRSVSAFVILKDGERVATVALKFPKDGANRLYAYVHWLGIEMVRGCAGGFGYDKRSAAVEAAAKKIRPTNQWVDENPSSAVELGRFLPALGNDDGRDWTRRLEDVGFQVLQAV